MVETETKKQEEKVEDKKETVVETERKIAKEKVEKNEGKKKLKNIKQIENTNEKSTEDSDEKNKPKEKSKQTSPKKRTAIVNGRDLPISTKHAVAICNFIKNKNIDIAIVELGLVEKKKKPVPMRGEIPHKKGIMSGRYPIKATGILLKLLKSLKSNAMANELELEKYKLSCMANVASRQYKRSGRSRFKRSHVQFKLTQIIKQKKKRK